MDKYFNNNGQNKVKFNCDIVLDEEIRKIHEAEEICKKENRNRIILGIIIGLVLAVFSIKSFIAFSNIWPFSIFLQRGTSTDWRLHIFSYLIIIIPSCLLTIFFVCSDIKSVESKYYNRIDLMNLIPQIDEILELAQISSDDIFEYDDFFVNYTLKNDSRKIVLKFLLEGYKFEKSRAVECLTIDVDSFTILKPY